MFSYQTFKKSMTFFIAAILLIMTTLPNLAAANRFDEQAAGDTAESAIELKIGQSITGTIRDSKTPVWFKVTPSSTEIFQKTHLNVETTGSLDTVITFYKNLGDAKANKAVYKDDDTGEGYNAKITVPIAWEGPYYMKVTANRAGNFDLVGSPAVIPPEDHPNGGACALEETLTDKQSGLEILSDLRYIRDHLLDKTARGKETAALYYKISPQLLTAAITNEEFRQDLYEQVKTLQPVIKEVAKISEGKKSSRVLSRKEYAALKQLKDMIQEEVTDEWKDDIQQLWDEVLPQKAIGEKLEEILESGKLIKGAAHSIPNRIIVKVKGDQGSRTLQKELSSILKENHVKQAAFAPLESEKNRIAIDNTYVVQVNDPKNLSRVVKELNKHPEVEYAAIDQIYHIATQDVNYGSQWPLENTGQFGGKAGSDISFRKLQQELSKAKLHETLIAVIDTGVDYTLADLAGIVRQDLGIDLVNDDLDPMDDNDHGTHVSGVIAARSDNGYSMAGIHPNSRILPIKVLNEEGRGYGSDIALGIKYAVDKGAKVINLSLGTNSFDQTIEEMLKYAAQKNVTVVAAAGNDGENRLSYPASSEYVISVGATNNTDGLASFSNYGEGLDMVAPGEKIASLVINGNVQYANGTSMATPHVAAVAGLLYSKKPSITRAQVVDALRKSSKDLGDQGYDTKYGWGRIDAYRAFQSVSGSSELKIKKLSINKTKLSILMGGKEQLVLKAMYTDGSEEDVTAQAEWTSINEQVATVNSGEVQAIDKGKGSITAAYGGKKVTVSVTVTERLPVILIPGIGGSQLYTADDDLTWIGLWETVANLPMVHDLELKPKEPGSTVMVSKNGVDIYTSSANHGLYGISRLTNSDAIEDAKQYEYMIADLEREGYIPGKTLFGMSYDWRFDISDHHALLEKTIAQALKQSGSNKVNIVAHSMGGLLVKDYLLAKKDAKNTINSVITIGTPYLGAAKASKALIMGDNFGIPVLHPETGYTIAKHAPSVYQLAPSAAYNTIMQKKMGRPVYLYIDHLGGLHPKDLKDLTDLYPYQPLVELAEDTHNLLDNKYASGVKQYHIVGDNVPTITGMNRWQIYDGKYPNHIDFLLSSGDGTVPRFSAENPGSKNAKLFYAVKTESHANMVKEAPVIKQVIALLNGDEKAKIDGISNEPSKTKINYHSYSFSGKQRDFKHVDIELRYDGGDKNEVIRFTEDGYPDLSDLSSDVMVESGIMNNQLIFQIILPSSKEVEINLNVKKGADIRLITYEINDKGAFNHTFYGEMDNTFEIVQEDGDMTVYRKGKRVKGNVLQK
jgi:pimeloyl-ACP methyl ester carboxylesterase